MKTLSKIILLSFLSFFCLAQVSIAEECKDDPDQCTPKNLCDISTETVNGQKYWISNLEFEEHVKFAKEIGIDCGASDPKSPCDLDANECKISELCEKATVTEGGDVSWNPKAEEHVELAKEYGLSCKVQEVSSSACQVSSPEKCDKEQICDLATYFSDGVKKWSRNIKINNEAKKRGLDCGLKNRGQCSQNFPANCSDTFICKKSTSLNFNKVVWLETQDTQHYVNEAKQRGLNCGISKEKSEADKAALTCEIIPSKCNQVMLCDKATWFVSGAKRWIPIIENIHVVEAKWRGLNCGIKAVTEVTSEIDSVAQTVINENKKKKVCPPVGEGDFSPCSNALICMRATINDEWDNSKQFKPFVMEAKKRGLDCGVTFEKTINFEASFKSQTTVKRKQIQFALKELGHYRMGIDGLWGNGTRQALMGFASDEFSGYTSPSSIFSTLLNRVSVPSTFASVKKPKSSNSSSSSNTKGWVPLSGNPKLSFNDAKDICEAKAQAEGQTYMSANQPRSRSNNFNCQSIGTPMPFGTIQFNNYSCSRNSGGFWGGFASALEQSQIKDAARDFATAVAKACMADFGWKKN